LIIDSLEGEELIDFKIDKHCLKLLALYYFLA